MFNSSKIQPKISSAAQAAVYELIETGTEPRFYQLKFNNLFYHCSWLLFSIHFNLYEIFKYSRAHTILMPWPSFIKHVKLSMEKVRKAVQISPYQQLVSATRVHDMDTMPNNPLNINIYKTQVTNF